MIASRTGMCPNVGSCANADSKRQFVIPTDRPFECPSCGTRLKDIMGRPSVLPGTLKVIVPMLALAGVLLLSVGAYRSCPPPPPPPPPPTPTPTPTPSASNCTGRPMHKNVLADIRDRGYVIMGAQASAPPMNDSPETDKWEETVEEEHLGDRAEDERRQRELSWRRRGFDYELAEMLVANMGFIHKGRGVRVREIPEFKDLFCLLNRQEKDGSFSVDMIMSGIARDSTYDDTISWSKPYLTVGYSLITKKSSYIETLEDCKDKRIGIVNGDNIVKAYVSSQLPGATIVELSDESDEWLSDALNLNRNVDAVIYDYPFAVEEVKGVNELAEEKGVLGNSLEIKVASLPNADLKYSIGVPKGEDDLLALLNDAIDKVTDERNTRYAELVRKYLSSEDIRQVPITPEDKVYIIKEGDSLSDIAAAVLGNAGRWRELAHLNNIAQVNLIYPGHKLLLPK